MKRWIVLILIGIVLCCFGMAKIFTAERLDFFPLAGIILSFIVGFICVIVSVVQMQRRTLEMLVQEADIRADSSKEQVNGLIFNKKVYNQGPKIVAIGGGTGLNSVLKGLKNYTDNLTAIVTVSDYGEIIPESRKMLECEPLDDIKQSIISLSTDENAMQNLMDLKFKNGKLKNLCFSDIYFLGMKEIYGELTQAVEQTKSILNITGKVLPVTLEPIQICAELEDGTVIESRDKIPQIVNSTTSKISRIFINPTNCKVAPGVIEAIKEADAIVIGPGSLYTNVIPNLLVKGVAKTIKESKAFKIYVSNIMTEPGQTDNYSLSDHIRAINEHAGKGIIDYCIYDTGELIPEYIRKYNMQGQELVEIDTAKAKEEGVNLMQREISYVTGQYIRHNPDAIAASIIQLICDDLKFKDMQNDTKYVLLNDKLKEAKKSLKGKSKSGNIRKIKKKGAKEESKFFKKYKSRIESIQEAELKMKVKAGIPIDEEIVQVEIVEEPKETSKKKPKQTKRKASDIFNQIKKNMKQNKASQNSSKSSGKHSKNVTKPKKNEEKKIKIQEIKELEEKQKKDFINTINKLRN